MKNKEGRDSKNVWSVLEKEKKRKKKKKELDQPMPIQGGL